MKLEHLAGNLNDNQMIWCVGKKKITWEVRAEEALLTCPQNEKRDWYMLYILAT
jgi:hypothetical protein